MVTAVESVISLHRQVAMPLRLINRRWTLNLLLIVFFKEETWIPIGPFPKFVSRPWIHRPEQF